MTRADQWKLGIVVLAILAATYYLFPSYQFYQYPQEQRVNDPPGTTVGDLREKAIPLGLDLQGGLHLVLEVDKDKLQPEEVEGAIDRATTIIRNRIDQFGVAEPVIQTQGNDRIVIQLPGVADPTRAKLLIGQTALLEFKLVRVAEEGQRVFNQANAFLQTRVARGQFDVDTVFAAVPLTSLFVLDFGYNGFILEKDIPRARALVAVADSGISSDTEFLWGGLEPLQTGELGRWLYVCASKAELSGGSVDSATPTVGLDQTNPGAWGISLQLNSQAGSKFAQLTQANVGRLLAIVLDGEIQSAPRINERIPRGTASITGSFTPSEAKDLAVVLEAGSLPAPVRIIEERTVGPSLGRDSIQDGTKAAIIGTILVVVFMLIYYQLSGGLAVIALLLNIYLLLALLAGFGATLTLPGIAGIILTVGMAVDANVLILERIREELRAGKTVRAAINNGYDRAFRTILDANVTTLISAGFLFQFGTGPIRGFAVTLSLGLIVNMFTAVLFTRLIYNLISHRRSLKKLSI
jgi:protein-export membrane protein SecD